MLQDLLRWILIMAIVLFSFIISFRALSSCDAAAEDEMGHASLPLSLLGGMLTGDALGGICVLETPAGSTWGLGISILYLVLGRTPRHKPRASPPLLAASHFTYSASLPHLHMCSLHNALLPSPN